MLGDIVRRIIKELRIPIRRSDLLHVVEKSINEILFVEEEYVRMLQQRKCRKQVARR